MVKTLLSFILVILFNFSLNSQCECTDCAVVIPNNGTASSLLDISGANNNTLGSNGQSLCMVCIELVYDAIQELDMVLIAPSGDEIDLMINTGIAVNDNITFEICFVPCGESADPDAGFPAVFDTDAGYLPNEFYNGSYYPAIGCLEDLTGSVDGEWELEMTDNVFLDNGELLDWYLVFTDDSGLDCANADECDNPSSCLANGGELSGSSFTACEGDASLDVDFPPSYPNGGEPPAAEFDYTYIIIDLETDIIEDISTDTDLSSYASGIYQICGLSYLIDDETDLPSADGSLELDDIQDQIDDDLYCADISDNCIDITIDMPVSPPTLSGPTVVCADEEEMWEILNYDPSLTYLTTITSGSVSQFDFVDGIITITFVSGPGEFCVVIESECGDEEECISIEVLDITPDFEITGELMPCPGSTEIYTVNPPPPTGSNYEYEVTGGTILNQSSNTVEIEWPDFETTEELCVELLGGTCEIDPVCIEIDIELTTELPDDIDSPSDLCTNEIGLSEINENTDILNYIWTATNLNIISGQGSNAVEYEALNPGIALICLEIETECESIGPECDQINIFPIPEPEILEPELSCELTIDLELESNPDNDIEWTLISGPGTVSFDPDDEALTTAGFSQSGIYEIAATESNAACEVTDIIIVQIFESLSISEPTYDCDLDYNYTVSFEIVNGTAPYSIDGEEITGNTYTSGLLSNGNAYDFEIIDDQGCTTVLEGDYTCPCQSDAGTMSLTVLSACLVNNELIVAEWEEDGVLDNNDIGLYYLHDGDDDELGFVFEINENGIFEYDDRLVPGQVYYISYVVGNSLDIEVDLTDDCLSVSEGQPIIFYDSPEIDLIIPLPSCDNSVIIDSESSLDMITIIFSQTAGPGTSVFSNNETLPVEISVSSPGTYSYKYQISNQACVDSMEITINFQGKPTISEVTEICNNTSDFYQVSFSIEGGNLPYTSTLNGIFNNNKFTSVPILSGTAYEIVITDSIGCSSISLMGNKLCDCNTNSGSLPSELITQCGTMDSIDIDSTINSFLDNDDVGMYYLHLSSTFDPLEKIDSSLNGVFYFNDTLLDLDSIYYVSFIVGNNTGTYPDPEDPCYDISNSQMISWLSIAPSDVGVDISTCDNELLLNASPNEGEWSLISYPAGPEPTISNPTNATSVFNFEQIGDYVLVWSTNTNGCSSSDTLNIFKSPDPSVVNLETECNDDLLSYNLTIKLTDGSPFFINQLTYDSIYTETMIPTGSTYNLNILNAFGCEANIQIDAIDCDCPSEIGSVNLSELNLCKSELVDISIFNQDYTLAEGDSIFYIIHDGTSANIGNIIETYNSEIRFTNSLETDRQYFLTMVIAPIINNEPVLSETCTLFSEGVPILWYEDNIVSFDTQFEECIGSSVNVTFEVSNYLPVSLTFENEQGDIIDIELDDFVNSVEFIIEEESNNWRLIEAKGRCLDAINNNIELSGYEENTVEFIEEIEICNNSIFGSTIDLNNIFIGLIPIGEWDTGSIILNNNTVDFDNLTAGVYTFTFSTVGYEDPCPGNSYGVDVNVLDCQCPVFALQDLQDCNTGPAIQLDIIDLGGYEGLWDVISDPEIMNPIFVQNNSEIILEKAEASVYTVKYTITDLNFPQECNNVISFELTLEEQKFAGIQTDFPIFCEDEEIQINLNTLLDNQDNGGIWLKDGIAIDSIISISDLQIGENNLIYHLEENNLCLSSEVNVLIEVESALLFELVTEDILCFGDNNGSIEIIFDNDAGQNIECYVNDIIQNGDKTIEGLAPGKYKVYIKNENCISETISVTINEPVIINISLGEDRLININEEITITAITNVLDSDISEISWSDLSEIIGIDILELKESFSNSTTIIVELTDLNGCIAFDTININVLEPQLYIPNVFSAGSFDNNSFGIVNYEAVSLINSFLIFDRWGNKMLDRLNVDPGSDNAKWDGRYNDQYVEQGVYVFIYDLTLITGENIIVSGDITFLR